MGRRWFDDLTGEDLADDNVHALVVTLDGDPLAVYDVGHRPGPELLDDLGGHLAAEREARRSTSRLDPGPLDESAEDPPSVDHDESSSQVSDPGPVDESAGDPPVEEVAHTDVIPAPEPIEPTGATTSDEPLDSTYSVGPVEVGEAARGTATDATVRRWNRDHGLVELSARKSIPLWLRGEYERLHGAEPDFPARALAQREGASLTTPSVDPAVATLQTIHLWCLRNGIEDRLPPTREARGVYAAAYSAAHPEPPAAGPAGQDPPTLGERAGQAAGRASGRSNGTRVPDFSSDSSTDDGTHYAHDGCDPPHVEPGAEPEAAKPEASVRPVVEPIGDGTGQPTSTAKQLERADELAAAGKTPKQICSETGVWLSEARAAVRKATTR